MDELTPPCFYCGEMPELELRNPQDKEYVLQCTKCGIEISDKNRDKAFREWKKYFEELVKYEGE